jgi:hypothetical protein
MFPTPLAILIWWGPESPWWLVRKGRLEEAAKAVRRLGRADKVENPEDTVAMMRRTIELEKTEKEPSLIELWKGTDRYRTLIVCCVYAAQNLTGNLIANQAVYFFERELPLICCLHTQLIKFRIWCLNQHRLRSRSHHLCPPDCNGHALLDSHHLSGPTHHLPLGFRHQLCFLGCTRCRSLNRGSN